MIPALALVPLAFLIGLPVLTLPVAGIAQVGGLAALAFGIGVLARVPALVTAGAGLALIQYALALWLGAGPMDPVGAAAFGVILTLALDVAGFGHRFRASKVSPAALRAQGRYWLAGASGGALACAALGGVATLGGLGLPAGWYPALAAVAALGTVAGVVGALGRSTPDGPVASDER